MRSRSAVPAVSEVQPRIELVPPSASSAGADMVELAAMFDLYADPWQERVLVGSQGERDDGKHAAFEVGVVVPRQNGKDGILEMRTLGGLLILGERLITYSAHQFDTSLEAFRRLLHYFENYDDLSKRVKRVSKSHGEEGIELLSGQRVRFRTRTAGGGRGFTGDCLFLNEAMILRESSMGALFPTLSARPNPQVWYTGSAVDQDVHEHGVVLARVRDRALRGDPRLAYWEYAAADDLKSLDPDDRDGWAEANPALGVRITEEFVESEQRAMAPKTFAVERLGVGDWPSLDDGSGQVISVEAWMDLKDGDSVARDPVCFAFDVKPDRSGASIAGAGRRADGRHHVGVVEKGPGTGWVGNLLEELKREHRGCVFVCDGASPAAALLAGLADRGIEVTVVNSREHAQACGLLFDAVEQKTLRHIGSADLVAALRGAEKRPLGDSWAWSRKNSNVDISPLVAVTLALWGSGTQKPAGKSRVVNLAEV